MKNNMLTRMEAKIAAREKAKYRKQLDIALQMGMDSAAITANEIFGMEGEQAKVFLAEYINTYNQICRMISEDSKDDPKLEYSTAKVDERLRQIVGDEIFVPWEERYG